MSFAILVIASLSACSTTIFRLEKAAEVPLDKVATILVSNVSLRYVDNRIFDLCGFDPGTCGVQVLPGKHSLKYNVYTTEVAREQGRGYNRNSLHNRVSRLKFEQLVNLEEGMVYELSFNEAAVKKFGKKYYPEDSLKAELEKNITFKVYEEKTRKKILQKIKKSKIIRTTEYKPDI